MDSSLPAGQMPLCPGCGVVAPLERKRCDGCDRDLEPRWWVPVAALKLLWVRVEASFECRACGHRSPINHLDVDGSVLCFNCGIEQRFQVDQWWSALEHAHGVADLTGPHREGLLPEPDFSIGEHNPHAMLGVQSSSVEVEKGEQALRVSAAPGAPLCSKCRGALAIVQRESGKLTLRCAACQSDRSYILPKKLSQRARALCGTVADEHEEGRLDAVLHEEAGVTALRCPTCGAGLTIDGSSIVTCQYCSTSSRVHPRARGKLAAQARSVPFWLLFEGPSQLRRKLRKRIEAERNKLEKQQRAENQRALAHRELARQMDRPAPSTKARSRLLKKDSLAIAAVVLFSGVFGAWSIKQEQDRTEADAKAAAERVERGRLAQQVSNEQEFAEKATKAKASGTPFSLSVTLDVVKAEGQALKPGAPCVIYGGGHGDSIEELHVSCGSALLYNSTTKVFGMRMMEHELYRDVAGGDVTGLRYNDTGQRTNGSEITLDTKLSQAMVSSQVVPLFRVELGPHKEPKSPSAKRKPSR